MSCFGRNERGVSAWGLARCHDTDDTNRGAGDTRTIRWMVKMARSETFEMSIDWRPERRPLSEWRCSRFTRLVLVQLIFPVTDR
jgi:hypothetical protein